MTRIKLGAAVALAAALLSSQAFAQTAGKAANDGGFASQAAPQPAARATRTRQLYNSAPAAQAPTAAVTGKSVNDGGLIAETGPAPRQPSITQAPSTAVTGKSVNDGGLAQ